MADSSMQRVRGSGSGVRGSGSAEGQRLRECRGSEAQGVQRIRGSGSAEDQGFRECRGSGAQRVGACITEA